MADPWITDKDVMTIVPNYRIEQLVNKDTDDEEDVDIESIILEQQARIRAAANEGGYTFADADAPADLQY